MSARLQEIKSLQMSTDVELEILLGHSTLVAPHTRCDLLEEHNGELKDLSE